MVRADFLVHGSSAMAEAAIYTNPALHCASLDVDYAGLQHPHRVAPWRSGAGSPLTFQENLTASGGMVGRRRGCTHAARSRHGIAHFDLGFQVRTQSADVGSFDLH